MSVSFPPVRRRAFLTSLSGTVAGILVEPRQLSARGVSAQETVNRLLPERMTTSRLQSLATAAVDAARGAGAAYADVRVAEYQSVSVVAQSGSVQFHIGLGAMFAFGVRARVGARWAFVHGVVPSEDAVAAAARMATAYARGVQPSTLGTMQASTPSADLVDFVPAPAVTGTWASPMTIDPFIVPLQEQMALLQAWHDAATHPFGCSGDGMLSWRRETRVVASTEGTLVTQHFMRARPQLFLSANRLMGRAALGGPFFTVPSLIARHGGYESVADRTIYDQIVEMGEEVCRLATLPARTLEVGRYPVVMDGHTVGRLVYQTLGQALELDRVLGEETDASGGSVLSPATEYLGTQIGSPHLTVMADRAPETVVGVGWDDEGTVPMAKPMIRAGRLVDYQTSRTTAAALAPWYQRQGLALVSRGCAVAADADAPVTVRCGHLTVVPSVTSATDDDLIRDMTHGLLVRQVQRVETDQQLSTGMIGPYTSQIFEVVNGRIVRRVSNVALQFVTLPLWKSLTALGDARTVEQITGATSKGLPWQGHEYQATAPAAHFDNIAVVNVGRH